MIFGWLAERRRLRLEAEHKAEEESKKVREAYWGPRNELRAYVRSLPREEQVRICRRYIESSRYMKIRGTDITVADMHYVFGEVYENSHSRRGIRSWAS